LHTHLNRRIDKLALDHIRGASEIVQDIASLLIDVAKVGLEDPDDASSLWRRAVKRLGRGQPSMAPVLNLLNECCNLRRATNEDWNELKEQIGILLDGIKGRTRLMDLNVAELPEIKGTLITYSNSSTVARIIIQCHKLNRIGRVYCSESRPINEGFEMARKLYSAGIDVTLFTDAALMSKVSESEAIWVGGDAFSFRGLVNKVGSLALAHLAQSMRIPMVSLMGTDKFLSPDMLPYLRFLPQNPRELAGGEMKGVNVVNEYYEVVPHKLITHIFTENGLVSTKKALKSIHSVPICPSFEKLVRAS